MEICEWCGTVFDEKEAGSRLDREYYVISYAKFHKCLCAACAARAIDDEISGVYYETCEKCGRTFDLIEAKRGFDRAVGFKMNAGLLNFWGSETLCRECALALVESARPKENEESKTSVDSATVERGSNNENSADEPRGNGWLRGVFRRFFPNRDLKKYRNA